MSLLHQLNTASCLRRLSTPQLGIGENIPQTFVRGMHATSWPIRNTGDVPSITPDPLLTTLTDSFGLASLDQIQDGGQGPSAKGVVRQESHRMLDRRRCFQDYS